ncbi:MAG: nucleotidyltransferase domain-containing protein [Cyclobacteriaceae bacterium]
MGSICVMHGQVNVGRYKGRFKDKSKGRSLNAGWECRWFNLVLNLTFDLTFQTKKMLTQRAAIRHLQKIAAEIKRSGIHLKKVILFGSYSKNQQHEWSDIDVAFVADEFKSIGPEDVKLFSKILIKYPDLGIQPRTYNTKDFTPRKDPFVEEILRTGTELDFT